MVTLKEIAKLANVNPSTVSRALNDSGYVHPETKEKIFEAASSLSYHPKKVNNILKKGKTKTIGVIVPSLQLNIFSGLVEAIEKEAMKYGYGIIIATTQDDPVREKAVIERFVQNFIDGLIIAASGKNNKLIQEVNLENIPVVQLIREYDDILPSVTGNYYQCAYDAVCFLASKGCRHIGLINGKADCLPFKERYLGYLDAMKKNGNLRFLNYLNQDKEENFDIGYEGVNKLLIHDSKLEAIVVANDIQGIGVLKKIKEMGNDISRKLKVISLTGNPINALLETSLSTMELPVEVLAEECVKMTLGKIAKSNQKIINNEFDAEKYVFQFKLIERDSTN
ncbi:LacI family DNA-binding transcriptional regulator [Tuanshanicoccus lijuaniae]|uniref:LacI family DNA-binding transcriptional regulator n=1 Tax=Aerococcaceae bacterium zg-1292 TaxID=2774330 RepID=UPI001936F77F|nr:LacI family DNA-binding transcriptional regulator [Aerococcaceae bacterium zg-1292]QQA37025.1 LacI family DNA-binding transcriptional regulator [Aerococcaceae bacterium zg-1292]